MTLLRFLILFLIIPFTYLLLYLQGNLQLRISNMEGFGIWIAIMVVIGTTRVVRARQAVRNFRLLCLGDQLKFSRGLTELHLSFSSISKVTVEPDGTLMIYTDRKLPFLLISKHLERRDLLLGILSQYVPIEHSPKKHFLSNTTNRFLFSMGLMFVVITFMIIRTPFVVVPIGIALLILTGYQVYVLTSQSRNVTNPIALILLVVMTVFLLMRIVIALGGFPRVHF
ncbi:MAG TPA: hypothetical protein VL651_00965 [Bacteroidia bacterium]|nr:hypothetical protein [Bacteroidia bacterium]